MSLDAIRAAFETTEFALRVQLIERESVKRLFAGKGGPTPDDDIETLAHFIDLALASEPQSSANDLLPRIDDVAHALCDAYDLVSRPSFEKRDIGSEAAYLFARSNHLVKAATLARVYHKPQRRVLPLRQDDAAVETTILRLSDDAYWTLLAGSANEIGTLARELDAAIGVSIIGVEGRYALFLSALLASVRDLLSGNGDAFEQKRHVERRGTLLVRYAAHLNRADIFDSAQRLAALCNRLAENASMMWLSAPGSALSERMLEALTGPSSLRPIYTLWPPQIDAIRRGLLKYSDFVICAPTSAGKTLTAELKIAKYLDTEPNGLAVYVAPYNALADQISNDLTQRFNSANIPPAVLWTGAYEIDHFALPDTNIIVTTPEKLDAIIRSSDDSRNAAAQEVVRRVGLFVFDECHLIGANSRGVTYEMLIARVRARFKSAQCLAMSAVANNSDRLAEWISNNPEASANDAWSPTRRRLLIYRQSGEICDEHGNVIHEIRKWRKALDAAADLSLCLNTAKAAPVLVVCTQRRYAVEIAAKIAAKREVLKSTELDEAAAVLRLQLGADAQLPDLVRKGVAYHHRGIIPEAKRIIEDLCRRRLLTFVASTTTLAEGVHFPFRSLVLPYLSFGGTEFVSRALFQNIIGRAGRAFSNVRATIIVLEPGGDRVRRHFKRELVGKFHEPINVSSRLSRFRIESASQQEFEDRLRLESQILGFVQDQTFQEDQVAGIARSTLAFRLRKRSAEFEESLQKLFDQLESSDAAALSRNSPYRLTPFGRAASVAGIAHKSAVVLRREAQIMLEAGLPWWSKNAWDEVQVSETLANDIALLVCTPFEYFGNSTAADRDYPGLLKSARQWYARRDGTWLEETRADRFLLSCWIMGLSFEEISARARDERMSVKPLDVSSEQQRRLAIQEYIDDTRDTVLWMLSAAIHISENICDVRGLGVLPFRRALALLEYGVPLEAAVRLCYFGVPRHIASRLGPPLAPVTDSDDFTFISRALPLLRGTLSGMEDDLYARAVERAIQNMEG